MKWALLLAAARLLLMLAAARLLLTLAAAVLLLLIAAVLLLLRRWAGFAAAEPLLVERSCCSSLESPPAFVVLRDVGDV